MPKYGKFLTMFLLFLSVHLIVIEVRAEEILTWQDCIKEAKKNHPDLVSAKDKLERLIDFHFRYFTGKLHIFQILFGKSGDTTVPFPYLLRVVMLPYQGFIEGVIKKGIDSGEFEQVNAVVVASSLLGMMQFNIMKIHFGVNDIVIEEVKDLVKHLVFKALLKTK